MKKAVLHFALMIAVLVGFTGISAQAAEKKKVTPPEPVRPFISSVSPDSVTVTTGQSARTLAIKPTSELLVNGQKAAATDLKVGMLVTSVGAGTDPAVLSRLSVADAPAAPSTGGKKKK